MYKIAFWEKVKIWFKYINVFSPGHPPSGHPDHADLIIAQAFGRTMFSDKYLPVIMGDLPTCQNNILSFKILITQTFDSGEPNIEIAKECYRIVEKHSIPLYAQWEIAFEMFKLDPEKYTKLDDLINPIWPIAHKDSFTTNDVLEKIMNINHFNNPILIANNWMSIRAALLIKKRMLTYPTLINTDCSSFNPCSTQAWTRDYHRWVFKETLVRIHHLIFRWV